MEGRIEYYDPVKQEEIIDEMPQFNLEHGEVKWLRENYGDEVADAYSNNPNYGFRYDGCCYVFKYTFLLIKEALKAVVGVGKYNGQFKITPLRILLFAFLVASIFLGFVSLLLLLTSIIL